MANSEIRQRFVSDFFPLAFLLILFLLAFVIPIMVPACLLHIWLWLRHPRTRRHYLVFAGLMAVPVGLFIILPSVGNAIYARDGHGSEGLIRTRYLPGMLMMLAGAGVVPILYRFVSSSVLGPVLPADRSQNSPRAGIVDGLALIVLCAVIWTATQIIDDPSRYDYSPLWSLIATVVVSLLSIAAMRINARCSRAQMFANFAAIWIGGWLALKGTLWGIDTMVRPWVDGPDPDPAEGAHWLFIQYRAGWEALASGFGTSAVAVFPLICRRYGLVLAPVRSSNQQQAVDRDHGESEVIKGLRVTSNREGRFAWLGRWAGHLCLLAMIAILTLYPFTWTEEYVATGYRVAGWPLVYWHAEQTTPSAAPWYWTDSSIWRSVDFDLPALVIDVLLTLMAWLVILPPRLLRRRFSQRSVAIARWTLGSAFMFAVAWNVFFSAMFRDWRLNRMESVTVNEYLEEEDFPLFQRIAHEIDTQWRGTQDRMQRGGPVSITIRDGSADEVDSIIRQLPTLKRLTLQNCTLPADRVSELAMDASFAAFTFESDNLPDDGIVAAVRSGRDSRYATTYTLKLTACGGEIYVPDDVDKLQLVIPHRRDSTFELKGMADLRNLEVHNTFGDVPNSVSRIRIGQAPKLETIRLDTMQKFALEIEAAPELDTLIGFSDGVGVDGARLTELKLSGGTEFDSFHLNLTDLIDLQMRVDADELHVKGMRLSVDVSVDPPQISPRKASDVQQILANLSAIRFADNLELKGVVCNDAMLRDLPRVKNGLTLNNCFFQDDIVAGSYDRFAAIKHLNVENLTATSRQIDELKDCAMNTIVVNSRGDFRVDAVITTVLPRIVDTVTGSLSGSNSPYVTTQPAILLMHLCVPCRPPGERAIGLRLTTASRPNTSLRDGYQIHQYSRLRAPKVSCGSA